MNNLKFALCFQAPHTTPMGGKYDLIIKKIPTLSIFGKNDHIIFQHEAAEYRSSFSGYFDEYNHEEKHSYPKVTKQLKSKILALLNFSGVGASSLGVEGA